MSAQRLALLNDPPRDDSVIPLLRKGFRIFFLLAGGYAVVVVPLWILVRAGTAPEPHHLDPVRWHAHEMLFGFTAAVIAGFLLTATSNWTKRVTAVGPALALLAAAWLAGRVVPFVPGLPSSFVAIIDLLFLPALAVALARPIVAARSARNYVFLVLVGLLFGAQVLVHLGTAEIVEDGARRGHLLALDVVIVVILVVAGRIIPAFTRNATGATDIRSSGLLDRTAVAGGFLLIVLDGALPEATAIAWLAGGVGLVAASRARTWGLRHAMSEPLLLVLHAGYAWVTLGLILRTASTLTPVVPSSAALHALTAGGIGTLTLGMMARVSLGHTGRPLLAGRALSVAFLFVTGAAMIRVVGAMAGYELYRRALEVSATLWALAFGIYVVRLAPALLRARPDGRPG
jgi:uncharacterized protein involved in response to NO